VPELGHLLVRPRLTLERVRVLKRDGERRSVLPQPGAPDGTAQPWQKLMVYASEAAQHRGRPLHVALVELLREHGAAGATALRGIWGFHGDHRPHGERFWSLRRHVPILTVGRRRAGERSPLVPAHRRADR
jgi:hypothetical protein